MSTTLRAATRPSPLALWQTQYVASLLGIPVEPVVVETMGDRTQRTDTPIDEIRGQGVFVKEVQTAVLQNRADIAVHSAKDLRSEPTDGLVIACVPERGDARDVIIGKSIDDLPSGGAVATGSARRRAQLAERRPDLTFFNLRGNIDTRLSKAKDFDAIVMANAALVRLERQVDDLHVVPVEVMLPQVAQGALAIECRSDDYETQKLLAAVEHEDSRRTVDAERAFLAAISGGCDVPVACHGVVESGNVYLRAMLASLDGHIVLRASGTDVDGGALGRSLAERLLHADGGAEMLRNR